MVNSEEKRLLEEFVKENKKFTEMCNVMEDCLERSSMCKNKIVSLQEEKEVLKQKRPMLLADKIDISEISERLKKIDEEIELHEETILGVDKKYKSLKIPRYNLGVQTNTAFKNLVKLKMDEVAKEYDEIAPKMVATMIEYITLDYIFQSDSNYFFCKFNDVHYIPSLGDSGDAFYKKDLFQTYIDNYNNVKKKYNIPNFSPFKGSYH